MIMISSKTVLLQANDLMDMQFLTHGSFKPSMVMGKIHHVIWEVVNLLSSTLENRPVVIESHLDQDLLLQEFNFDSRRLQQVLYNLLTNAIKFTRQGTIIVAAKVLPCKKLLSVKVIDQGIGMSEDEARRVFDGNHKTKNKESR